ncbi:cation:proton antiporter [Candidatus Woesearchaeota archaeon]|nr:cation:proton antiporter [Candidatus Woesearchaeota archaeon]
MVSALVMVLIALALAYLLSEFFRWFGMPRVVGQICAGLFLGFGTLRLILFHDENLKVLHFLSNLGIILLFYYIGLEMNVKSISKYAKKTLVISLFKALFPFLLGYLIMRYAFNFSNLASIIIGVSLSAGAQSVTIDLLDELKMLKSRIGSMIISIGVITDIIELLIVGVLLAMFEAATNKLAFPKFLLFIAVFFFFIIAARIWFIPYTLRLFDREKSSTSRFMGAMIIVLLVVALSEFLGIGALVGALVAGIIIRQTIFKEVSIPDWEEHDIARSIHIIAFGFLIPLFFVWIGLNTDLSLIISNYIYTILFIAIAIIGVIGGTWIAVLLSKGTSKEGVILGWGLSPKGDIGFVVGALALEANLINPQIFSSLIIMAMIITIVSPIVFKKLMINSRKH